MKIKQKGGFTFGSLTVAAFPDWLARRARKPVRIGTKARPVTMRAFNFFPRRNTLMVLANRIKIGLAMALLTALTGCIGVVGGDGYYDGGGYVGGWWWDDGGWWGGGGRGDDRGHDVHGYSARGAASRGAAHGGGGHAGGGGHGGGGGRR
jgi:hypothetical protein